MQLVLITNTTTGDLGYRVGAERRTQGTSSVLEFKREKRKEALAELEQIIENV